MDSDRSGGGGGGGGGVWLLDIAALYTRPNGASRP
mgnify:CR=1 FL=1